MNKYFKILDIHNNATLEEVKQAYRDLAQIWHPDHVSTKNPRLKKKAEEKMKELNEAKNQITTHLTGKQTKKDEKRNEWEQAERERAEAAKKAKQKASKPDSRVVAHDGNFVAYTNGVVYDEKTGLEWFAGPDRDTTWNEAKRWVENLTAADGGWRMPTMEELKTLYQKGAGNRNMTPLLKTTGWWVWSGEPYVWSGVIRGSPSAWLINFDYAYETWDDRDIFSRIRGFAVRSRR